MERYIITINGGSSSIKFSLYGEGDLSSPIFFGKIDRIGVLGTILVCTDKKDGKETREISAENFSHAIEILVTFLAEKVDFAKVVAIGRIAWYGEENCRHYS
jgi:acetate kinase